MIMIHKVNKLVYASLFLALALDLPFLTGQIPQIGMMLTPMHFPVLLCGYLGGLQLRRRRGPDREASALPHSGRPEADSGDGVKNEPGR